LKALGKGDELPPLPTTVTFILMSVFNNALNALVTVKEVVNQLNTEFPDPPYKLRLRIGKWGTVSNKFLCLVP